MYPLPGKSSKVSSIWTGADQSRRRRTPARWSLIQRESARCGLGQRTTIRPTEPTQTHLPAALTRMNLMNFMEKHLSQTKRKADSTQFRVPTQRDRKLWLRTEGDKEGQNELDCVFQERNGSVERRARCWVEPIQDGASADYLTTTSH